MCTWAMAFAASKASGGFPGILFLAAMVADVIIAMSIADIFTKGDG